MAESTPVTVLTGFLGAGKTTLLNHLLRHPEFARSAVLVNEFGEVGLDHLLFRKLGDTTVLLNAGCLCCTVRGDLVRVLREMLPRARRDEVTRIIIETTGLADPLPVLASLMTDPVVATAYRLDGVVAVVDAVNGGMHLDSQDEAVRQVAVADRIVISKADLADPAPLQARLRALNPGAPITLAAFGAVDPASLLGLGPFDLATRIPDVSRWLNAASSSDLSAHHHNSNRHDSRIGSFCLTFEEPIDWLAMEPRLAALIATRGEHLLRIKGILNLRGCDRPVVIHAVRHLLHPPAQLAVWPDGDPRSSRIVFITRDLSSAVVEAELGGGQPDMPAAEA